LKTTKGSIKNSPIALGWACPKQLSVSILGKRPGEVQAPRL